MCEWIINRLLVVFAFVLLFSSTVSFAAESKTSGFGIYGGLEYLLRILKLNKVASGRLIGFRVGVSYDLPLWGEFGIKSSLSAGASNGKNDASGSTAEEKFESTDIKPSLYLSYDRISVGYAVRKESLTIKTSTTASTVESKYSGYEHGPTIQYSITNPSSSFGITVGIDYLTGKLANLESSQLGAKLQIGYKF